MLEKLNGYDILAVFLPGVLLLAWITICIPDLSGLAAPTRFPEAFDIILLISCAILIGHIVQALASLVEPLLFISWGGRPSDRALDTGIKGYIPSESSKRIRSKLEAKMGSCHDTDSIFLYAMQLAEKEYSEKCGHFNALYAFQRSLFTSSLLAIGIFASTVLFSTDPQWSQAQLWTIGCILSSFSLMNWYRAKQRAVYYVRIILLSAESTCDEHVGK